MIFLKWFCLIWLAFLAVLGCSFGLAYIANLWRPYGIILVLFLSFTPIIAICALRLARTERRPL